LQKVLLLVGKREFTVRRATSDFSIRILYG
jgi:hypothetical protein